MPIVEAVGLAVPIRSGQAVRIEAAMTKELKKAQGEGVKDAAKLRERILKAMNDEQKKFVG